MATKSNSTTNVEIQADSEGMNKLEDNSELDKKDVAIGNQPELYYLYSLHLKLTCAIPEDQNTRGRKINDPEESDQKFGILVKDEMPPVSKFPIYTRSGEVFVTTKLLNERITLTEDDKNLVLNFHNYTFSKVLRLVKYPMIFSPDQAENSIIVLPLKVLIVPFARMLHHILNHFSNIFLKDMKVNNLER